MADDLNNKGPQDRSRINLSEPYGVRYWCKKLKVSEAALERAVKAVGFGSEAVEQHFRSER